jgi:hypothetical protein
MRARRAGVQVKLFVEHMHETNMASLVATLDSEKWVQADVSPERQAELDRLTAGKASIAVPQPPEGLVGRRRCVSAASLQSTHLKPC